jgi:TPR repeat protein
MPYAWTAMLLAICVSIVASRDDVNGQAGRELSPKAAEQYASDSEKAAGGDPDAAYRLGEALESGRFGGLKNLNKALSFYRLAAEKGHKQAAARAAELEAKLGLSQKKPSPAPAP